MKGIRIEFNSNDPREIGAHFYVSEQRTPSRFFLSNREIRHIIEKKKIPNNERLGFMVLVIGDAGAIWQGYYPFSATRFERAFRGKGIARLLEFRMLQTAFEHNPGLEKVMHFTASRSRKRQLNRLGFKRVHESGGQFEYSPKEMLQHLREKIRIDTVRNRAKERKGTWLKHTMGKLRLISLRLKRK